VLYVFPNGFYDMLTEFAHKQKRVARIEAQLPQVLPVLNRF
jgi:hypothetical protein